MNILDKCDMAGVWKVNQRMAEFCLGFKIDLQDFLKAAPDRIEVHKDKWLIKKFINFQYGDLTEANKVFRSVQSCLSSFGENKGHLSPLKGGKDKTKTSIRQDKDNRDHKTCLDCERSFPNDLAFRSHTKVCREAHAA